MDLTPCPEPVLPPPSGRDVMCWYPPLLLPLQAAHHSLHMAADVCLRVRFPSRPQVCRLQSTHHIRRARSRLASTAMVSLFFKVVGEMQRKHGRDSMAYRAYKVYYVTLRGKGLITPVLGPAVSDGRSQALLYPGLTRHGSIINVDRAHKYGGKGIPRK